jgi:hypothetical protein
MSFISHIKSNLRVRLVVCLRAQKRYLNGNGPRGNCSNYVIRKTADIYHFCFPLTSVMPDLDLYYRVLHSFIITCVCVMCLIIYVSNLERLVKAFLCVQM